LDQQVLMMLRNQVAGIMLGTVFLLVAVASSALAAFRGRGRDRILLWFGIFNAMYGARILIQQPAVFSLMPSWASDQAANFIAIITYLILIPALLFWLELSLGRLRQFLQFTIVAASVLAVLGVYSTLFAHAPYRFMNYNKGLAIWSLLPIAAVNAMPRLARKNLVIQSLVSAIGTLALACAVLYLNVMDLLQLRFYGSVEPIAFALFVFSLGYVAAEKIFSDGRRLLSIENELAIARDIQNSILPGAAPELASLRIHAAYHPMTAVAGDFYDFIPVDEHRIGFLVADVSGHGVPAALIAAMIKVAMQSVIGCADNPAEVLRRLNHILSGQLRGQFVTAAYLWLDTESQTARYSAAGHPPLLRWRQGKLGNIESNGLLFGVLPDCEYPAIEMPLEHGDRYLLYTDGVVEPENSSGDSFGDASLEQVVRMNEKSSPSVLSDQLLLGLRNWQPTSTAQQDDITLLVIDVV
jgi:phosphoserine phosphatase RsbU/P